MDLIDMMLARVRHIEPRMTAERLQALEAALRQEFGGATVRVKKKGKTKQQVAAEIMAVGFDGNVERLAIELGCHRSTIYRVIRSRPKVFAK
jgi:DNA invertase Pin-like site-specific DNA recombinase